MSEDTELEERLESYRKQMRECSDEEFAMWFPLGCEDVALMRGGSYAANLRVYKWRKLLNEILRDRIKKETP